MRKCFDDHHIEMCVWESVWGRNCQRIECVYRKIKNKKNRKVKKEMKNWEHLQIIIRIM